VATGVQGVDTGEVIQVHRRYMVELMQEWTRLKTHDDGDDLNFALVVDAELFRLDAVIRWLDAADGRLARAAASAPSFDPEQVDVPTLPMPRRLGARR
jgi:hypothetical protein